MIRSTSEYSDYPMGAWAANREDGIRNYPYSLVSLIIRADATVGGTTPD
jgi:hypothetical protein